MSPTFNLPPSSKLTGGGKKTAFSFCVFMWHRFDYSCDACTLVWVLLMFDASWKELDAQQRLESDSFQVCLGE